MNCSLEEALSILSKWKDEKSPLHITVNVGPVRFGLVGIVSQIEDNAIHVQSVPHVFSLLLSGATFNFEDELAWSNSSKEPLPGGIEPLSALGVRYSISGQFFGECILLEIAKPSNLATQE